MLDKEVALRSSELGDSYEKTQAFVTKFADLERAQHSTDMDTSELSGWYSGHNVLKRFKTTQAAIRTNTTHGFKATMGMAMVLN